MSIRDTGHGGASVPPSNKRWIDFLHTKLKLKLIVNEINKGIIKIKCSLDSRFFRNRTFE